MYVGGCKTGQLTHAKGRVQADYLRTLRATRMSTATTTIKRLPAVQLYVCACVCVRARVKCIHIAGRTVNQMLMLITFFKWP